VVCASFAIDTFKFIAVLPLLAKEGKLLYMAWVDPILTIQVGCEVVLGVDETLVQNFLNVQHLFIQYHDNTSIGTRSMLATLFIKTGIMPLQFRRE
jgi:hypothetical protein